MYPLYPSAKMTTWRGTNTSASIDLIGQMIDAVRTKGIAVMLYTHPRDGHDMSSVDQNATGWGTGAGSNPNPDPATFNFSRWNDFINDIYGNCLTAMVAESRVSTWTRATHPVRAITSSITRGCAQLSS
jgi:hypothetical protein